MKTGIFYATTGGTTADVASRIANRMGVDKSDVYNVADIAPDVLANYELIIMGSPTYGAGELQDDWYDFLAGASAMDLRGKYVAFFGLGDESMTDTFCNAVGELHRRMEPTGATMVGMFPTAPYQFEDSEAVPGPGPDAYGLLIDEVNDPKDTDSRIDQWCKELQTV